MTKEICNVKNFNSALYWLPESVRSDILLLISDKVTFDLALSNLDDHNGFDNIAIAFALIYYANQEAE